MSVTLDTSHFEISILKDAVPENMNCIFIARDTSHLEMSELKNLDPEKILDILVTADTSHSPIGPVGPFEKSSTDEKSIQAWTAVWSSFLVAVQTLKWNR